MTAGTLTNVCLDVRSACTDEIAGSPIHAVTPHCCSGTRYYAGWSAGRKGGCWGGRTHWLFAFFLLLHSLRCDCTNIAMYGGSYDVRSAVCCSHSHSSASLRSCELREVSVSCRLRLRMRGQAVLIQEDQLVTITAWAPRQLRGELLYLH